MRNDAIVKLTQRSLQQKIQCLNSCINETVEACKRWSILETLLPPKKEILVRWMPRPLLKIKINADGVAKGNLGWLELVVF